MCTDNSLNLIIYFWCIIFMHAKQILNNEKFKILKWTRLISHQHKLFFVCLKKNVGDSVYTISYLLQLWTLLCIKLHTWRSASWSMWKTQNTEDSSDIHIHGNYSIWLFLPFYCKLFIFLQLQMYFNFLMDVLSPKKLAVTLDTAEIESKIFVNSWMK